MKFKKIIFYFVILLSLTFIFFGITLLWTYKNIALTKKSGFKLALAVINNQPEEFNQNFKEWQKQINKLNQIASFLTPLAKYLPTASQARINAGLELLDLTIKINPLLPNIIGVDKPKIYFILLQNNLELRPSGGFMGSYAKLTFNKGGLENITVQDIYVPDGQLTGHIDPPWPIQAAFGQGWWKLRDSNWEPDFPAASQQIAWFFNKGGEENSDGIIALNLLVIKDLVKIFEPLQIPDLDQPITTDNFYQLAQNAADKDFFPGSTQKKDFLSAVAKQLIFELKSIKAKQLQPLTRLVYDNLQTKQILISFNDAKISSFFNKLNWDGSLKRNLNDNSGVVTDYFYIVDTNLSANKANCCVERQVNQEINIDKNLLFDKLNITYKNNSQAELAGPPFFWGGLYKNFLRIILPQEVEVKSITIDGKQVKPANTETKIYEDKGLQSIGFFVIVLPQTESKVEITYQKPINQLKINQYALEIQKQPGIESYHHVLQINKEDFNKNYALDIIKDTLFKF